MNAQNNQTCPPITPIPIEIPELGRFKGDFVFLREEKNHGDRHY